MYTVQMLKQSLSEYISAGKSGVIALCGEKDVEWDEMVYLHSLEVILVHHVVDDLVGFTTQDAFDALSDLSIFNDFVKRDDVIQIATLDCSEDEWIDYRLETLLNDLAHSAYDDNSIRWYNVRGFIFPSDFDMRYPKLSFTLIGADNIADDVKAVKSLVETGKELSMDLPGGEVKKFLVKKSNAGKYTLSVCGLFTAEDYRGGEFKFSVGGKYAEERTIRILEVPYWREFYAATRFFIYQNFFAPTIN